MIVNHFLYFSFGGRWRKVCVLCCFITMAKEFAGNFYKTKDWKKVRDLYREKAGGLCEVCWANGLIVPGVIVHHKIHLDESNINNPDITLNMDNLQLVCRDCHAEIHSKHGDRRYLIDKDGTVKIK